MFFDQLKEGLIRCGLQRRRILLAVSGGADSVALLVGCQHLQGALKLDLRVAHLDHCLREESAADAEWVVNLCEQLSIPITIDARPVGALGETIASGIEENARRVRYDFLTEVAEHTECSAIVTAHHAGDQVETVLHHFLRGTGVAGLRGMANVRSLENEIELARPMLLIDRKTIDSFLREHGQSFRDDVSNKDQSLTRNRIRGQLLPMLEADYNARTRESILRLSRQAKDIDDMLNQLADQLLSNAVLEESPDMCRIDCQPLSAQPVHLQRHCFIRLWTRLSWPRQKMGFHEWNRLAECCASSNHFDLPGGIRVATRHQMIALSRRK